jgi:hypothetical protein
VDLINNGTGYASTADIFTNELRNPDTNAGFYVTIHTLSPSTDLTPFTLKVSTSSGNFTIPQYNQLVLNGRESKIIVTDFTVGKEKLVYSTAEILTVSVQDEIPLVFLWLPEGEDGEFILTGVKSASVLKKEGCSALNITQRSGGLVISYTQASGTCVLKFDNGYRFALVDRSTAYLAWVPSTSVDPYTPENSTGMSKYAEYLFWHLRFTVIVQGPYLVRSVSITGTTLQLTGDYSNTTDIEVYAPHSITHVTFNGENTQVSKTSYGSLVGKLGVCSETTASIQAKLPVLTSWKFNDGLPERMADYDDSRWTGES